MVAVVNVFSLGTFFGLRTLGRRAQGLFERPLGWLVYLTPAFLALALATAEVRRRLYAASALERLALGLRQPCGRGRAAARRSPSSLEDPSLRILYRLDGRATRRWVDETVARGPPVAGAGRR